MAGTDGATGAACTGAGGGGGGAAGAATTWRLVPGLACAAVTGLFRTTVWSLGLAPASAACRCLSASSRVLKIRKKAFRPSMSKTTLTFGWTLTSEMPPFSGVTESDRLIRYPRPVEFTYFTFSISMMKRSTPRSFTEFKWVWNVMTVLASMDPFRITRAVPDRPLTS